MSEPVSWTSGTVYGTAAGVAIVLRPWMGRVIDQQGRRRVVMGAGLMSIVALLTFMTIDSFGPAVIGITILNTAAQILVFTSLYTFAADIVPLSHRTQGLMLFAMSFLVPIGLGSVLGDAILAIADFDVLFLAAILFLLASMTIVATLAEPSIDRLLPRRSFFATLRQKDLRPLWLLSLRIRPRRYLALRVDAHLRRHNRPGVLGTLLRGLRSDRHPRQSLGELPAGCAGREACAGCRNS